MLSRVRSNLLVVPALAALALLMLPLRASADDAPCAAFDGTYDITYDNGFNNTMYITDICSVTTDTTGGKVSPIHTIDSTNGKATDGSSGYTCPSSPCFLLKLYGPDTYDVVTLDADGVFIFTHSHSGGIAVGRAIYRSPDCIGSWSNVTTCSKNCGGGTQTRQFTVGSPMGPGGAPCAAGDGVTESQPCNTQACPVDCAGSWSAGACSKTCGGGARLLTYSVTTAAANGGNACAVGDGATASQACNTQPCPVDCVGSWVVAGACSKNCGGGTQSFTYSVSKAAANGGNACSAGHGDTTTQPCNTQPCPVDCAGSWGAGACSKNCGNGTQSLTYSVTTAGAHGGSTCEAGHGDTKSQPCNTQPCPVDCVGSFGQFGECSGQCGGRKSRQYDITQEAMHGGEKCGHADKYQESWRCNVFACVCPPSQGAVFSLDGTFEKCETCDFPEFNFDLSDAPCARVPCPVGMGVRDGSTTSTCEACEATDYSDTTSGQCKKKTPCGGSNVREVIPAQTIMPAMCCDDSNVACQLTNMATYVGAATHVVNQFSSDANTNLTNLSARLDDIGAASSDASWW